MVDTGQASDLSRCADVGRAPSGNNALFNGCTGCVQCIIHSVLLLLHLHFSSSTNVENSNTTCEFGEALLQLLLVVIRSRGFDLGLDLTNACVNLVFCSAAIDNGGVVLVDGHFLCGAQVSKCHIFEFQSGLFRDDLTAGQDGDVLQHGLAAVAESRCLNSRHFERAADLVHHEGGQCFAVDVLCDDQQRASTLSGLLQAWEQVLHGGDFLVVNEDVGAFELCLHLFAVGHEVGRQVAAVELHALDGFHLGLGALGLFNSDYAFVAHNAHRFSDQLTHRLIVVG